MTLRFRLLGGCEVATDKGPLRGFISQKSRALLAYLVMDGGEHSRHELAALLWGETPEAKALTNLRQALANLRRLVGPHLMVTRHTVAFDHSLGHELDVDAFLAAAEAFHESRDAAAGERAATIYRGDFLAGLHLQGAAEFETWMAVRRESLHEEAARLFYRLAVYYEQSREYEKALTALDRLLALEPWREEAHRQRMTLLARLGRYGAALRQYETCRRILHEELGVDPAPATLTLLRKIRELQRRPPDLYSLPPQPTPFIGRQTELARLTALLLEPEQRLITLVGMGGVGKTRLALEAARLIQTAFLDGVTFVALAHLRDPDALAQTLAQALGLSARGRRRGRSGLGAFARTGASSHPGQLRTSPGFRSVVRTGAIVSHGHSAGGSSSHFVGHLANGPAFALGAAFSPGGHDLSSDARGYFSRA